MTSNVGGAGVYEAKDQRTTSNEDAPKPTRNEEGEKHSHQANDPSTYHLQL